MIKMIDITAWMNGFLQTLNETFANRVWFVGLQGSYGRGEATEASDIDVVVILDELSAMDIQTYNGMLDTLSHPLGMNMGMLGGLSKSGMGLFATPHTYHIDIRFEQGFTQMSQIVAAVTGALKKGKRVIVEHFDLLYPHLKMEDSDLCINADLIVGIGAEVMVTRPSMFGPFPQDIADISFRTIKYRKMVHTAEDLVGYYLEDDYYNDCEHWDVKNGFVLGFREKPKKSPEELEALVKADIAKDLPVSFYDDGHIKIGEVQYYCTAPRNHVRRTSEIEGFTIMKEMPLDPISGRYLLVGLVGRDSEVKMGDDIDKIKHIF